MVVLHSKRHCKDVQCSFQEHFSSTIVDDSMSIEKQFGNGVREQNILEENHSKTNQRDQKTLKERNTIEIVLHIMKSEIGNFSEQISQMNYGKWI